jgi:hypothetical protein
MSLVEFNEQSETCEQPKCIKITLKPHQLTILKHANKLENNEITTTTENGETIKMNTKFGVLCDNVGAGKSLEMLSIIANSKKCNTTIHHNYSFKTLLSLEFSEKKHEDEEEIYPVNIIIVPHTIIKQWIKYIEDYTTLTFDHITSNKHMEKFREDMDKYVYNDILLVASTRYRDFEVFWCHLTWTNPTKYKKVTRLIFDEADAIKIVRIAEIPATFYWFMTSSYMALQNPYGQLKWSNAEGELNDFYSYHGRFTKKTVISGISNTGFIKDTFISLSNSIHKTKVYNTIFLKNNNDYVAKSFKLIPPEMVNIICSNPRVFKILNNLISAEMMNMINGGNIQGAMEQLNCYTVEDTNLIETVTKELNIELDNKVIEYQMKIQMTFSSKAAKEISLTRISKEISTIQNKIQMLTDRIKDQGLCSVCCDDIDNKTVLNCCHSAYCFSCITTWLVTKSICPLCRAPTSKDNIIIVSDKIKSTEVAKPKLDTKLNKLKELIYKRKEECEDFKFLVFTEHENIFSELITFMNLNGLSHGQLKGTTASVNKQIEKFKRPSGSPDSTDCLLLNANFCGNGINLENSTDVFIYHSMSKEKTNQVIGRAQRPGRNGQLKVWQLCYENEVA